MSKTSLLGIFCFVARARLLQTRLGFACAARPVGLGLVAAASALSLSAPAQGNDGVGIIRLSTRGETVVPVAVWYPSSTPTSPWNAGPYRIEAMLDSPVKAGRHPLILLSHGSGGSEYGHSDLAQALAGRGYVVAAPRHLGDSYDQPEGRASDKQMTGRPWQAVATLDAVLADPRLSDRIDAEKIGMAGFSAGGYTTLIMIGARPDMRLHSAYCQAHGDDRELCPGGKNTKLVITRRGWQLPQDQRVRAAVVMAPLSVMFDKAGVQPVKAPLRIYKADDDQVLRNRWNADRLLDLFGRPLERGTIKGGHYVFVAPCTAELREIAPPICNDPPGVDRLAEHAKLNAEIVDFFDRQFRR